MNEYSLKKDHRIDFIFPLVLFLVFALFSLAVLVFAGNVYKEDMRISSINNESETALSYLNEKIHQSDESDAFSVFEYEGNDIFSIKENVNGTVYCTYIYFYDGYLRELYSKESTKIFLSSGKALIELDSFSIEKISDDLYLLSCKDTNENTKNIAVSIRSERGDCNE